MFYCTNHHSSDILWSQKLTSAARNGIYILKLFWLSVQAISQDNLSSKVPDIYPMRIVCWPSVAEENCSVVQVSWAFISLSEKKKTNRKSQAYVILVEIKVKLQSFWPCSATVEGEVPTYQGLFFPIVICQQSIRKLCFTFCYFYKLIKNKTPKNPPNDTNNNVKKLQEKTQKPNFKISSLPCSQFPVVSKFNQEDYLP